MVFFFRKNERHSLHFYAGFICAQINNIIFKIITTQVPMSKIKSTRLENNVVLKYKKKIKLCFLASNRNSRYHNSRSPQL